MPCAADGVASLKALGEAGNKLATGANRLTEGQCPCVVERGDIVRQIMDSLLVVRYWTHCLAMPDPLKRTSANDW